MNIKPHHPSSQLRSWSASHATHSRLLPRNSATYVARKLVDRIISEARPTLKIETVFQRYHSATISIQLKWKDFHFVKRVVCCRTTKLFVPTFASQVFHLLPLGLFVWLVVTRSFSSLSRQDRRQCRQFGLVSCSVGVKLESTKCKRTFVAKVTYCSGLSSEVKTHFHF
jgi:hypothetical protein